MTKIIIKILTSVISMGKELEINSKTWIFQLGQLRELNWFKYPFIPHILCPQMGYKMYWCGGDIKNKISPHRFKCGQK